MTGFFHRNWDYLASLGNSAFTIATFAALPWDKVATLLFVTLPVGLWSWVRFIDYMRSRNSIHANPIKDCPNDL